MQVVEIGKSLICIIYIMFYIVLHDICIYYLIHMWFKTCRQVYLQSATNIWFLINIFDLSLITNIRYEIFPSDYPLQLIFKTLTFWWNIIWCIQSKHIWVVVISGKHFIITFIFEPQLIVSCALLYLMSYSFSQRNDDIL